MEELLNAPPLVVLGIGLKGDLHLRFPIRALRLQPLIAGQTHAIIDRLFARLTKYPG